MMKKFGKQHIPPLGRYLDLNNKMHSMKNNNKCEEKWRNR